MRLLFLPPAQHTRCHGSDVRAGPSQRELCLQNPRRIPVFSNSHSTSSVPSASKRNLQAGLQGIYTSSSCSVVFLSCFTFPYFFSWLLPWNPNLLQAQWEAVGWVFFLIGLEQILEVLLKPSDKSRSSASQLEGSGMNFLLDWAGTNFRGSSKVIRHHPGLLWWQKLDKWG